MTLMEEINQVFSLFINKPDFYCKVWEDNQSCAQIVKSGKSAELRHVKRVHGVCICSLNELYKRGLFIIRDCHTRVEALKQG